MSSHDPQDKQSQSEPSVDRSKSDSKPLTHNPKRPVDDSDMPSVPSTAELPQTGSLEANRIEDDHQPTKRIILHDLGDGQSITAPDAIKPEEGLALFLPDSTTPIVFQDKDIITIGRADRAANINPELDLTDYHGATLGVSRYHAVITRVNDVYHIKDMGSTNGTRVNGKKLPPYTLTPITSGDQIRVGHLTIVVG